MAVSRKVWTYGLVLNRRFWEERPAFVTILTPGYGIIEVKLAWIAGKRDALFMQGALEPMALSWFQVTFSRAGAMSEAWEAVDLFDGLRIAQPAAMLQISMLIHETVPLNEPVPELFRFALKMLRVSSPGPSLLAEFTVGLLELMGYGIGELVNNGDTGLGRFITEEPDVVLSVCRGVLRDALGVEL